MKIEEQEQTNAADEITEEASDPLGSPDQEESDDGWTPDSLSEEDRARYDAAVKAVDDFVEHFPRYRQTERNRELILGYLSDHSLEISPAALALAYEQLESELDLAPEDSEQPQEEQPDASARLATAGLARGSKSEDEPPESVENEPVEMPEEWRRGQPVAWRNGRAMTGVGS